MNQPASSCARCGTDRRCPGTTACSAILRTRVIIGNQVIDGHQRYGIKIALCACSASPGFRLIHARAQYRGACRRARTNDGSFANARTTKAAVHAAPCSRPIWSTTRRHHLLMYVPVIICRKTACAFESRMAIGPKMELQPDYWPCCGLRPPSRHSDDTQDSALSRQQSTAAPVFAIDVAPASICDKRRS